MQLWHVIPDLQQVFEASAGCWSIPTSLLKRKLI
jgi:hypothetical protein